MTSIVSSATQSAQTAMQDISSMITGRMTRKFEQSDLIVVTQAEAHFESHVIGYLLQHDTRVRAVANDEHHANLIRKAMGSLSGARNNKLEVAVCSNLCETGGCNKMMEGATYLVHAVAMNPAHYKGNAEEEMLKPSIEGTKCVLEAAKACGTIKKACLISNCYALGDLMRESGKKYNAESWFNISREDASKLTDVHEIFQACNALGEKTAWDWLHSVPDKPPFPVTAVLPSYVVGPELLDVGPRGPNKMIVNALTGHESVPLADMGFVDARDVAKAAIDSLQDTKTDGKRYILTAGNFLYRDMMNWARDIGGINPSEGVKKEEGKANPNHYDDEPSKKDLEVHYTSVESSVSQMLAQVALHAAKHAGKQEGGGGAAGGLSMGEHRSAAAA